MRTGEPAGRPEAKGRGGPEASRHRKPRGLPLTAGPAACTAYACLTVAALARIAAGSSLAGDLAMPLTDLAAGCWIAGFLMFVIGYRRVLTGRGAKD